MSDPTRTYSVDRIEGALAVLVPEGGGAKLSVPVSELPHGTVEGAVLRVDVGTGGAPVWSTARLDEERRRQLEAEARDLLRDLRRRDPGGNISL